MRVPVMHIGIVRMSVDQVLMNVRMGVRFGGVPGELVRMPVVLIVRVGVRVFLWLVGVQMPMVFSEVEPDAGGHQQPSGDELKCHGIALDQDGQAAPRTVPPRNRLRRVPFRDGGARARTARG